MTSSHNPEPYHLCASTAISQGSGRYGWGSLSHDHVDLGYNRPGTEYCHIEHRHVQFLHTEDSHDDVK